MAALWGNVEAVSMLLRYGADTNAQNRVSGATPLHAAVQSVKKPVVNRIKCIQLILDTSDRSDEGDEGDESDGNGNGCNPHITDFYGLTALDALKAVMEKRGGEGCDDNEDDIESYNQMERILSEAVLKSANNRNSIFSLIDDYEVEKVQELLTNSSTNQNSNENSKEQIIYARDLKSDLTPLFYAIEKIISMELEFFDFDAAVSESEQEKQEQEQEDVHVLIMKIQRLRDIICSLLDNGAPTTFSSSSSSESNDTQTNMLPLKAPVPKESNKDPMHEMCKVLSSLNVKMTKSNEDDDNDDNCNQITKSIEDIILHLLSKGISISTPTKLLFHDSSRRGNVKNVKFWVEKLGVDVNLKGRQGLTALHFAARSGKVDVVKYLLENEFLDLAIQDDRGKTAEDAALVNNKEAVLDLLRQFQFKQD